MIGLEALAVGLLVGAAYRLGSWPGRRAERKSIRERAARVRAGKLSESDAELRRRRAARLCFGTEAEVDAFLLRWPARWLADPTPPVLEGVARSSLLPSDSGVPRGADSPPNPTHGASGSTTPARCWERRQFTTKELDAIRTGAPLQTKGGS